MTARGTCLVEAGSPTRAPWIEALACFADNWTARRIFEIAFAARFADLPHGATPARSNPGDVMVAKEGLQSEPRPKAPDFSSKAYAKKATDAKLIKATTDGVGTAMPAFKGKLTPVQVKSVVAYIRTLAK